MLTLIVICDGVTLALCVIAACTAAFAAGAILHDWFILPAVKLADWIGEQIVALD